MWVKYLKLIFNRTSMFYIGIAIIAGVIWFKFNGLKNQIENLENIIVKKDLTITEQLLELEKRKANELVLKQKIEDVNATIESMRIDNDKLKQEIVEWENKKPEKIIQVVTKVIPDKKITLENCTKVIKNLKQLKYDEL